MAASASAIVSARAWPAPSALSRCGTSIAHGRGISALTVCSQRPTANGQAAQAKDNRHAKICQLNAPAQAETLEAWPPRTPAPRSPSQQLCLSRRLRLDRTEKQPAPRSPAATSTEPRCALLATRDGRTDVFPTRRPPAMSRRTRTCRH